MNVFNKNYVKIPVFKIGASFVVKKDGTIEYWITDMKIRGRNDDYEN